MAASVSPPWKMSFEMLNLASLFAFCDSKLTPIDSQAWYLSLSVQFPVGKELGSHFKSLKNMFQDADYR